MATMIVSDGTSTVRRANHSITEYDERSRDIFGDNYGKLQQLKAKYDPNNLFNKLFAITPEA